MHVLTERQIRRNRRRLSCLLMLLLVPFVLAWILVRFEIWRPSETINQGSIIQEKQPFYRWPWQAREHFPDQLKQHWLLVLVQGKECQIPCAQWQYQLQQIHKALGKEGDRVRRVLLQSVLNTLPAPEAPQGMGDIAVRRWHNLMMSEPAWQARPWLEKDYQVLVVDPFGNLVTGYAPDHSGSALLKDLRRLLKASSAG
ncbi:hypothetical protein [Oceanospirillum sediminis]|uniref:Thioredoxin domain-containing protein n=1 Tax=Oceanospirillum sediminis TaxID=2760088 RepID=A0A839IQQ2_9GAMM|nr:hypothetical protein [Oceanospirillum sediminis]MBB1486872.1 hypothetical protein [Oceanospirillum sediminis]